MSEFQSGWRYLWKKRQKCCAWYISYGKSNQMAVNTVKIWAYCHYIYIPLRSLNFIFPQSFLIENLLVLFFKWFDHKIGMGCICFYFTEVQLFCVMSRVCFSWSVHCQESGLKQWLQNLFDFCYGLSSAVFQNLLGKPVIYENMNLCISFHVCRQGLERIYMFRFWYFWLELLMISKEGSKIHWFGNKDQKRKCGFFNTLTFALFVSVPFCL